MMYVAIWYVSIRPVVMRLKKERSSKCKHLEIAYIWKFHGFVISGFCRDANEISPFLSFYAAYNDNSVSTFRDRVSVPSSGVRHSDRNLYHSSPTACILKMGLVGRPETPVRNYLSALRKIPEERKSRISWSFSNLRSLLSYRTYKK